MSEIHLPRPEPDVALIRVRLKLSATRRKNLTRRWSGTCIYKVREVKSPYHQVFRGNRILVALPNMEGRKPFDGTPAPSFLQPFLIFQTSDYLDNEVSAATELLIRELKRRGFQQVEHADEYAGRMLRRMGMSIPLE